MNCLSYRGQLPHCPLRKQMPSVSSGVASCCHNDPLWLKAAGCFDGEGPVLPRARKNHSELACFQCSFSELGACYEPQAPDLSLFGVAAIEHHRVSHTQGKGLFLIVLGTGQSNIKVLTSAENHVALSYMTEGSTWRGRASFSRSSCRPPFVFVIVFFT